MTRPNYSADQARLIRSWLREKEVYAIRVEEHTRDMLDECFEPFKIGSLEYPAGRALEAIDPVAFRCCVADEISLREGDDEWVAINDDYYDAQELEKAAEPCLLCSEPCLAEICDCQKEQA